MKNKLSAYVVFGFLLLWAVQLPLLATDTINFKHISLEQGLSQTAVYCILEDSNGFMWFGTQDGLNKFDGYDFTVYRPIPGDPYSINDNYITTLYKDRSGTLWIGTNVGGLNRFDYETERFYHYNKNIIDSSNTGFNLIYDIYQDKSGIYWIGTASGVNRFEPDTGTFTHYHYSAPDDANLKCGPATTIVEDLMGELWIGTPNGLNRVNRKKGTITHYRSDPSNPSSLNSNRITKLYLDFDGYLWVGTTSGLHYHKPGSDTFKRYLSDPKDPGALSYNLVLSIFEDLSKVMWIGTLNGLNKFDSLHQRFSHFQAIPHDKHSLSSNVIISIAENRSGTLWVGTDGAGINRFDRTSERFITYSADPTQPDGIHQDPIFSIYEDRNDALWIGYASAGLDRVERANNTLKVTHFNHIPGDSSSLSEGRVTSILEDNQGVLWVGLLGSGLERFESRTGTFSHFRHDPDDPTSLSCDIIRTMHKDHSGTIWIGTGGEGLNSMEPQTGKFTRYLQVQNAPSMTGGYTVRAIQESSGGWLWITTTESGLLKFHPQSNRVISYPPSPIQTTGPSANTIQALYEDPTGILWLGTFGGGLNRFDPVKETFTYFREKDGLPNDVVYGILPDDRGYLWLSTNKGLSQFDPRTRRFKNYTDKDGLQGNEYNGGSYFKSPKGELFFGGISGFNAFFPRNMEDNPYVPPILLTEFRILNIPVSPGPGSVLSKHISQTRQITLSHKQNVFSFEFVALDYTIPEKNQYAYKMEGFDRNWISTPSQKRYATYTNLDPGEYTFRVKGSNNDGVWNYRGVAVHITIKPPLTRTWWFRLLMGLFFLGLAVFLYRYRTRELSQQTRLKTEMQTARDAQMSIMPQSDPQLPGFEVSGLCVPANEVGGDFFDYLWLNEEKTRLGIAIGDVSGKAMKAAMTAIMSSGILFSKAGESDSIQEIMTRTNRPIYFKTDKRMFTALCLAALDIHTNRFTFTNAGLSHPMLKSGATVTLLRDGNPQFPLGLKKDNIYREKETQLHQGDVLLLFTDGIPETQNFQGQFYEYKNLKHLLEKMNTEHLSAAEIKQRIIDDTHSFAGSAPQHDDITIVVIKVLEEK